MTPEETQQRLDRLEANVAHLERLVDQLNEALVEQGRHVVRLQKRADQLAEAWNSRDQSPPPAQERPPHYGR